MRCWTRELDSELVSGEVSDGVLELRTPVCRRAGEAVGVLGALRAGVRESRR